MISIRRPTLALCTALIAASLATAQGTRRATVDLAGVLAWNKGDTRFELRFSPFDLPSAGTYAFNDDRQHLPQLWIKTGSELRWIKTGELRIEKFDPGIFEGQLEWSETLDGELRSQALSFEVEYATAEVTGAREVGDFPAPRDEPNKEDLVFCAIGSAGTGRPGQHRIAQTLAKLAPTGPLDFVLLLGDSFYPSGVQSMSDELWKSRFESVYDRRKLNLTFYAVSGDRDHEGSLAALEGYSNITMRWTMPRNSYSFEKTSHGKRIAFVAMDTTAVMGSIRNAHNRMSRSVVAQALEASRADWKIVFGHAPMYSHGAVSEAELEVLRRPMEHWLEKNGVDLYISGGDRNLQMLQPKKGVLHVISGSGGGPEVAQSVSWEEDTVFAHTGGGLAWFRFDGEAIEISFRDADGAVLFCKRLTKS